MKDMILDNKTFHLLKTGDKLRWLPPENDDTRYGIVQVHSIVLHDRRFQFSQLEKPQFQGRWNVQWAPFDVWEWIRVGEVKWFSIWEGEGYGTTP